MRLRQIRILLAIAENGLNITAAAEKLFTSQPGVSKQLKLLEEELQLKIFSRKGKSLEAIQSLSQRLFEDEEGALAIATTHTQARYVLPEVIAAFRERYPKIRVDLHQGTSEQIASMAAARQVDFAIASGSNQLFPDWALLPCYRWDRAIIVPRAHPLASQKTALTLADLARYPLVTYVFSFDGESSLKKAFAKRNLEPDVVFTARDADVIKTYVRMGLGVGIVASMAEDCDGGDLVALSAAGLFPRSTTWVGFPRDLLWRRYMYDFLELLAPHLEKSVVRSAAIAENQAVVDQLFAATPLPLRGPCNQTLEQAV
jgi:LysR family cys regulon transcriptional activator